MKSSIIYGYTIFEDGTILSKRDGKPMTPTDNGKGYLFIGVMQNGKKTTKAVHRLVAEAFLPNPENLTDVDHRDGNRRNNHVSNLRWVTHGDNIKHSYDLGNRSATGEDNARCNTTEAEVIKICELLQQGLKPAKIRTDYGLPYDLIRRIKRRSNWTHISKNYSW